MKKYLLFLGALAAWGQSVSLSDTLTNAVGGAAYTGRITVTLNAPAAAQPLYYSTSSLTGWQAVYCVGVTGSDCTTTTAAGAFAATLYANSTITPAGTSYSARFQPSKGAAWAETWVVTPSATTLRQVRSTTVPTPTTTFQPSQLVPGSSGQVLTTTGGAAAWADAASGSGTVTSVSVTTANGVSGTVANATTTPAITLTLGAITPTTVVASGNVSGANLSGTNTGDQTTITGNAGTATALAANPTDCSAGQYANAIAASGNLTCAAVAYSDVSGTPSLSGYVAGAGALTTVGAVPYVSSSGTLGQDGSFLRVGTGKYTLYDATATTGTTKMVIRQGAGDTGAKRTLEFQDVNGTPIGSIYNNGVNFGWLVENAADYLSAFVGSDRKGVYVPSGGRLGMRIFFDNEGTVGWSPDSGVTAEDVGLTRAAAGYLKVTNGSTGLGKIVVAQSTPSASSDACTAGAIWTDATYLYACTASGAIKRVTLAAF